MILLANSNAHWLVSNTHFRLTCQCHPRFEIYKQFQIHPIMQCRGYEPITFWLSGKLIFHIWGNTMTGVKILDLRPYFLHLRSFFEDCFRAQNTFFGHRAIFDNFFSKIAPLCIFCHWHSKGYSVKFGDKWPLNQKLVFLNLYLNSLPPPVKTIWEKERKEKEWEQTRTAPPPHHSHKVNIQNQHSLDFCHTLKHPIFHWPIPFVKAILSK